MAIAPGERTNGNYHTQALSRGLRVLEVVAAHGEPATLSDLHEATDLPKSTLVRLLSALCDESYLFRVDDRPSYRLGHKVAVLSAAYVESLNIADLAGGELADLARQSRQTANLAILDGVDIVHLAVEAPDRPLRFDATVGGRAPAWCTGLGKALLADLDPDELTAHIPTGTWPSMTSVAASDEQSLRRDLERIRDRGYSIDDNEFAEGLTCLALPVRIGNETLGAVSISGPSGEFDGSVPRFLTLLHECIDALVAQPAFADALRAVAR